MSALRLRERSGVGAFARMRNGLVLANEPTGGRSLFATRKMSALRLGVRSGVGAFARMRDGLVLANEPTGGRSRFARLALMLVFLSWMTPVQAQTAADYNEGLQATAGTQAGDFTLSWWGKAGRTYFIQQSFDLMTWQYVPVVVSGAAGKAKSDERATADRATPRASFRPTPLHTAYDGAIHLEMSRDDVRIWTWQGRWRRR